MFLRFTAGRTSSGNVQEVLTSNCCSVYLASGRHFLIIYTRTDSTRTGMRETTRSKGEDSSELPVACQEL